ncbi:MAG: hypothetical protein ABIJ12_04250, partial [bacterium]
QSPYTKKVEAGYTWINLRVDAEDSINLNITNPYIMNRGGKIKPDRLGISQKVIGDKKFKTVYSFNKKEEIEKSFNIYTFPEGSIIIGIRFSPYYEGMGMFEFPIQLNLGELYFLEDTISLNNIPFNATRHLPDSVAYSNEEL